MTDPTAPLSEETRSLLAQASTATLTTQLFKRGLRNVLIQGVRRLTAAAGPAMVGPAFTLRYIPAREDLEPFREHRRAVLDLVRYGRIERPWSAGRRA